MMHTLHSLTVGAIWLVRDLHNWFCCWPRNEIGRFNPQFLFVKLPVPMHALDLADLANTYVRLVPAQIALKLAPPRRSTQDYWLTCRYRHENWMHDLSRHRDGIQRPGTSRRTQLWHEILPTIQEILLSEPLARALAYHATVLDELRIDREFTSLANSSLHAHVEARHRCLHLIVFGQGLTVEQAVGLNRLRRTVEKYSDQLLANMQPIAHPDRFAFEPRQLRQAQQEIGSIGRQSAWVALHSTGLVESFWRATEIQIDWRTTSARLNYQLSQTVLRLISEKSFDSVGVPHSCRMGQLAGTSFESTVDADVPHPLFFQTQPSTSEFNRQPTKTKMRRLDGI